MENFDINRFFKVFLNSKFYIVLIILTCLAVGYFYSYHYVTPMYQSSATVVLVQNEDTKKDNENSSTITQTDITLNKNLLATYTKIAKSDKVLEQVIEKLNLDISAKTLSSFVSVQAVNNTQVFKITVSNEDKELAASITNELLNIFSNEIKSLYHMNNVYTMDQAVVAEAPYNINHIKDFVMFFALGIAISFGLAVVLYLLDNTIKSEKDIEEYAGLSVLSSIPIYLDKKAEKHTELIVNQAPKSPISECFKTFRTNIMFSIQNKKLNTILVTSGDMGEGKSFVSSNLAITFAQSGKKVILVDTDMRKGRVHKIFEKSNTNGLSNCLAKIAMDQASLNINDYIQESNISNLHIMTSGNVPPNPSELLSSSNMIQLLEALNRQYDIVICDGTPCMLVSDSIILSKIVDTTVIVTACKSTKLDTLLKIKKSIEIVGGNIGGTVINKMPVSAKSYQNQYYYGNHNEISDTDSIPTHYIHDSVLDTPLYVKELKDILFIKEEEIIRDEQEKTINDVSPNLEIQKIESTVKSNSEEISELKNSYRTVMQNTFDALKEKPDSMNIILSQLDQMRQDYESAISIQKEQMEQISNKLLDMNKDNSYDKILEELSNIQTAYELTMEQYYEEIDQINHKIMDLSNPPQTILEQLNKMKEEYQDIINMQNKQIASLDDKISNIDIPDSSSIILDELELIKQNYQDIVDMQNKQIASLDDKISNIDIPDSSSIILDELELIKQNYQDIVDMQNKQIASLDDKISNIDIPDYSSIILDELETIKQNYENITDSQNENLKALQDKIDNITNLELHDEIISEFDSLKDLYDENLSIQNNQIAELKDKLIELEQSSNSPEILESLNILTNAYKELNITQSEKLTELENKLENINTQNSDTDRIIEKIDKLDQHYCDILSKQDTKIEKLEKSFTQEASKDDSELLKEVSKIYHQLESMNARFESLEKRAANNEILIKNLTKEAKNSFYHPTKTLDINQLNRKVIQIQDYLESKDVHKNISAGKKQNKNILDGQMNIIDDLLKNVLATSNNNEQTTKSQFIVDYESVNQKQQRKGFSLFQKKVKDELIEEEPLAIVSQILSNKQENVV